MHKGELLQVQIEAVCEHQKSDGLARILDRIALQRLFQSLQHQFLILRLLHINKVYQNNSDALEGIYVNDFALYEQLQQQILSRKVRFKIRWREENLWERFALLSFQQPVRLFLQRLSFFPRPDLFGYRRIGLPRYQHQRPTRFLQFM